MLYRVYSVSVLIEILLFPWINAGLGIEWLFYTLLSINIIFGLLRARIKVGYFSNLDLLLSGLIALFLLNPSTYWEPLGISAVYLRIFVFFIRYILLRDYKFENRINSFSIGVLVSSLSAMLLWINGSGDPWRLNFPYGDPNYQGFIYVTYGMFIILFKDYWKGLGIIPVLAIFSCILVAILGASRGTAVSLAIVLSLYLVRRYSLLRLVPIALLMSFLLHVGLKNSEVFSKVALVERVVNPRTSDTGAADSRFIEINAAFREFRKRPYYSIFGFGLSRSASKEHDFFESRFRIHNTPVAILFDSGVVGLLTGVLLFGCALHNVRNDNRLYLLIFICLNALTFYTLTFYHFFICLLFLRNQRLE